MSGSSSTTAPTDRAEWCSGRRSPPRPPGRSASACPGVWRWSTAPWTTPTGPQFADETLGSLLTTVAMSAAGAGGKTSTDAAASAVRKAIAARRKAKEDDWREERGKI